MDVFDQQIGSFQEHLKTLNRSLNTIVIYTQSVKHLGQWMSEEKLYEPRHLTPERIRAFQSFYHKKASSKNYSPETIHTHLRGIKRFLEYLEETHQLLIGPTDELQMPRLWRHRTAKEILKPEEITKMIECWESTDPYGSRSRTVIELLYSTGLRLREAVALNIDDIDLKGGYLRVNLGKGAKDRIQPLGRSACRQIKHYLENARLHLLKNPQERALFLDRSGERLDPWRIHTTLREAAQRAGLAKKVCAHMIRRSFATHLLRNDAHPVYVKEMLGHSSLSTLDRYIKLSGLDLKKEHAKTHPREAKFNKDS